jgi:hypothetical protein
MRKLGGALFGDRRFGHVFMYYNGAESYLCRQGVPGLARGLDKTEEPGDRKL